MGHLNDSTIEKLVDLGPELTLSEAEAAHLEQCEVCRDELRLARQLVQALDQVPLLQAPDALFDGVMRGLTAARSHHRQMLASLAVLALTLVATLVLWILAGGISAWALETWDVVRSLRLLGRVGWSLWVALPPGLAAGCALVMVSCTVTLIRLVVRSSGTATSPRTAPEAG